MECVDNLGVKYSKSNKTRGRLISIVIAMSVALLFVVGLLGIMTIGIWIKQETVVWGEYDAIYYDITETQLTELSEVGSVKDMTLRSIVGLVDNERVVVVEENYYELMNYTFLSGGLPKGENEIVLNEFALESYEDGIGVGDEIEITFDDSSSALFIVSGIIKDSIFTDVKDEVYIVSDGYLLNNGVLNESLMINVSRFTDVNELATSVGIAGSQVGTKMTNSTVVVGLIGPLTLIGGLIVLLASVAISNIFSYSIIERIKTSGLLKSVGMTHRQLKTVYQREGGQFVKKGIGYGFIISLVLLLTLVFGQLAVSEVTGLDKSLIGELNINVFFLKEAYYMLAVLLILISVVVYFSVRLSIGIPFNKTRKISIIESMNYTGGKNIRKSIKSKGLKDPITRLAITYFMMNKRKTFLPVILLSLTVTIYIFFASFLNSMDGEILARRNFQGDISIIGDTSNDDLNQIRLIDGVEEVGLIKRIETTVPFEFVSLSDRVEGSEVMIENLKSKGEIGLPATIIGYNALMYSELGIDYLSDNQIYLYDPFGSGDYNDGDIIGITVEDEVVLLEVVTHIERRHYNMPWYADIPMIIMNEEFLSSLYDYDSFEQVVVNTDGSVEAVTSEVRNIVRTGVTNIEEIISALNEEFFLVASMGYGLLFVIAFISLSMIINNVYTSVISRRKELAMLKCVGMTKSQMVRYIGFENSVYVLITAIISVPLGYYLGEMTVNQLASVNPHFSWTFDWSSILSIVFIAVVIYLVTHVALNKLDKVTVAELIKD